MAVDATSGEEYHTWRGAPYVVGKALTGGFETQHHGGFGMPLGVGIDANIQRSYDPKYFGLYSSHSQRKEGDADAVEDSIDKRGNIFGGAMFKVILPLALIMFCFAFWGVWRFLHPTPKPSDPPQAATGPAPGVAGTPGVSPAKPTTPAVSDEWRVVGYFDTGSGFGYQLLLSNGERGRLLQPPIVKVNGFTAEGLMPSGEFATSWSGAKSRPGPMGAMR